MPRKQRIEYPGAIYHVMSRGNYRKELFLRQNTGEAFESLTLTPGGYAAEKQIPISLTDNSLCEYPTNN